MSEVRVVQFLGEVQEHVQHFLEGQFTWENDSWRVVLINVPYLSNETMFYTSRSLIFILPESVSTEVLGCVWISDDSIGSSKLSASVSGERF